jgi:hypothetical protein
MARRAFLSGISIAAAMIGQAAAATVTGFSLGDNGSTLVRFDPNNLTSAQGIALSGDGARLDAIDFRPATGQLIGYDSQSQRYFEVDPLTGALRAFDDGAAVATSGSGGDIDFNPTIDRLRLVTTDNDNVVFNPENGATTQVTDLFYVPGDANAGADPNVVGNAYTNSFAGNFGGQTTQYVLDSEQDVLAILGNNTGQLTTVAALRLGGIFPIPANINENTGFDIFFDGAAQQNIAYVIADIGNISDLFILNLTSGVLTTGFGSFTNNFGRLRGLAVADLGEVPLPAALPLFIAGFAGLSFASRRRKTRRLGSVA